MAYIPTQVKTNRAVKTATVIRTKYFMMGYKDKVAGKPFHSEYDTWELNDQWNYERGRQYGTLAPQIYPKNGQKVTKMAEWALNKFVADKSIF